MSNITKLSREFADMAGWNGQIFTAPQKSDYELLGKKFLGIRPDALSVIMPSGGSFDSVEDYKKHILESGRTIEYHIASKLIACFEYEE